jgi:replicative DNA helicase
MAVSKKFQSASRRTNLRIPPQNIESEKALLGSIMLKPDVLNDIIDILSHDSFYAEKHRIIYKTMLELFGKNEPIDILSMSSKLKEKKSLEQIGGRSYLAELVNIVPSAGKQRKRFTKLQSPLLFTSLWR